MAMNDHDYCEEHGLPLNHANLAFVARVREAGAYLRRRAYREYCAAQDALPPDAGYRGRYAPESVRNVEQCRAAYAFEDRMMATRRILAASAQHLPDAATAARQREELQLRSASPMRPLDRQTDDVDGLALFDAVRSPTLL